MPVHNAMPHLPAAIESILSQTFRDFELFIGDDSSTDGGFNCIRAYATRDSRIRYARSEMRMGPVASSNWVANEARAPIVARMDGDDISHPRRFELQMQVLAAQPDAAMVGTLYNLIDGRGRVLRDADASILIRGKFVPFAHPTVMYRKEVFERAGGYREGTDYFEDTDLIRRFLKQGSILVIGERLLSQRKWVNSARLVDTNEAMERALIAASESSDADPMPDHGNHKITPGNLRAILDHAMWSGSSAARLLPVTARLRMLPLTDSVPTLGWLLFCSACPPLARRFGRLRVGWRNYRARDRFKPEHVYRWVPGRQAVDLGSIQEGEESTSSTGVHAAS